MTAVPTDVIMPALGAAQDTGTLLNWLKQEGDAVTSGEPLMLVETDKTTVELEAPATGTLTAVTAAEGDEVPVGTVIALILAAGEIPQDGGGSAPQPAGSAAPGAAAGPLEPLPPGVGDQRVAAGPAARVPASPKVRRLARERGIDLATVSGSGPGGAILVADIDPQRDGPSSAAGTGVPLAADRRDSAVWRAMAANVTRSWQAVPHFYLFRESKATALAAAREQAGPPTTYTDLLVAALARALRDHPAMVAGDPPDGIGIGVAVGTPDGLLVPVIGGADRLRVEEITARRRELMDRVKAGRHTLEDLTGAVFTISNLGMYGVDQFQAIVIDGQAGILAVGQVKDKVVVHEGNVAILPILSLSLSCDHRLVDGLRAAEFFSAFVGMLEDPALLSELATRTAP